MKKLLKIMVCGMALVVSLNYGLIVEAESLPTNAVPSQTNVGSVTSDVTNWDSLVSKKLADLNNAAYGKSNPFKPGLCTWYAWGRIKEVTGQSITFKSTPPHANDWPERVTNCSVNGRLTSNCVAVRMAGNAGHVAFVEHVDGENVYYTEDNENPSTNRKVIKTTIRDFKKDFTQFIHLKN